MDEKATPNDDHPLTRLSEAVLRAEEASHKASGEAGLALKAKQAAEENAKAVAQIKGGVEADVGWLSGVRERVDEATRAIVEQRKYAQLQALSAQEAEQQAKQAAQQASDVSKAATELAPQFETLRQKAQLALAAVKEAQGAAEKSRMAASDAESAVSTSLEIAKAASNVTLQARDLAIAAQQQAEEHAATLKALSEKAAESLAAVETYEARLKAQAEAFDAAQTKIEALLPNATSAGLASAFRTQKDRFQAPQWGWLAAFLAALIGLVCAALFGIPASSDTWDAILRHLVNRLPLAAPLIWMAIYSARHYGMAVRVQEEYAFKEALSTAFEGYKREMDSIRYSKQSAADAPLLVLCQNVLMALSERPGRIYEGQHHDVTPLAPLLEAVKDGLAQVKDMAKGSAAKAP